MGLTYLACEVDMNIWGSAVDNLMALQDAHILILGTCDYVTLHGKKDFGDVRLGKIFWIIWEGRIQSQES